MQLGSLQEVIDQYIHDGQSVALEGFTHLIPFAAGHEIVRQKKHDLHLIRMTPDLIYDQLVGAQKEAALAASTLVVTVEEIVESLAAPMNAIVLPHWVVTAIAEVPTGAYPSYAHGYYTRDNAFYLAWDGIARDRERFTAWITRHVLCSRDHAEFLDSLAEAA